MALGDLPGTTEVPRPTDLLMQEPEIQRAMRHIQAVLFATPLERHTLGEALARYELEHLVVDGLAQSTIEWRTRAIRVLQRWADRDICDRWRDVGATIYAEARKRGLGEAAASLVVNTLARVLNLARTWGWRHDDHDLRGICRVRSRRRVVHVSDAQARAVGRELENLPPSRTVAAACVQFVWLTGMRVSEAGSLRWAEVDLELRRVMLDDSKTGPRCVELCRAAVGVLQQRLRARVDANPFVFPSRRGDRGVNRRRVLAALDLACSQAGMPRLVVHALRHHFATVGAQLQLPATSMSLAMGHTTQWQTTEYQHPDRADVQRAVEQIGSTIASKIGVAR